ncbi:BatD family protein [Melioribacteraceae bacterium 4301-Me]|uniref:BatD family protein n=1 Tax=Pyranulibacter aquaticus TaxID=3163344 RepID=UPI00359B1357
MKEKNKIAKFLYLFFWFALIVQLKAQQFTASVDRTTVGENETFQVDFTFSASDINGISNFKPPAFSNFKILSGPNQSTSMQFINGTSSASVTYSYILTPSSVGEFEIGQATVSYKGKNYFTNPLKVKVIKGTTQPNRTSNDTGISTNEIAKNLFIVAEVDKKRAYLGEQVTVTYKLYTRLNISSPQIAKLPTYEGFWAEEIDMPNTINFDVGMYNGERYRVAKLKEVALFPSKTGKLKVTPFELNIPVIVRKKSRGNNFFDDFFNDSFFGTTQTVNYEAKSNTVEIQVDPLPSENVPKSFNGAVGNFSLKASVDKNNVQTNEGFTLRIVVSGTGNFKLLNLPQLILPAGFEKYDPKVIENINRTKTISGQKIYDYLIIPRTPGEKEIPPIEFSYFNPTTKRYVTLTTSSFKINVTKAAGEYTSISPGLSKEDIKLLSEDIRYIKTSDFNLKPKEETSIIKNWFWAGVIVPIITFIGVIGFVKRREKISSNLALLRFQKAEKSAKQRLRIAKKALDNNDIKNFYSELSQALFGYLEDKLNIQKSEFTLDLALNKLAEMNIDQVYIEKTKSLAEKCELARFAPVNNMDNILDVYNESVKLIVNLENSIEQRRRKK